MDELERGSNNNTLSQRMYSGKSLNKNLSLEGYHSAEVEEHGVGVGSGLMGNLAGISMIPHRYV